VFVRLVDEIGGVDVVNETDIYDATYPTYDFNTEVFQLAAGPQHLDGETALKYVRTRHGNSDFDRAARQQQVIFAMRDKVLSLELLPGLVQKAPGLYQELQSYIDTNLTLDQMIRLAVLTKEVPKENIRTGIINADYVISYETPEGARVEIPNRANIGELLSYVFWLP
jgi:anionic cell wall polymer biosynthesis LytR-Cps2A-Psr (LCP) family protein